jgi:pimeloyl-ACP methyl ester carboxylesterase
LAEHFVKRFFKNFWGSRRPIWMMARILLLVVIGFFAFVMLFEDRFIYFPSRYPEGMWDVASLRALPGENSPKIEDVWMTTADGVRIHGWYCSPQANVGVQTSTSSTGMTLLWFHGNAGNLSHRYGVLRELIKLPVAVFIIDYRGYGRSEGSPSEQGLYWDARAAWNHLTNERRIPSNQIVIFGDSLGAAVAIDLAAEVEAAGLIVQSGFTSIADMAAEVLPFVPGFIIRTKMDSLSKIPRVNCPKLFIHSPVDEMVPYQMGRRLFDAAREPKWFYEVANASHNEMERIGGRAYFDAIGNFVRSCALPAPQ